MEKEWRLPSSGREIDRSLEERVRESATGEAAGTARTPPRRIPSPAGLHGSTSDACTLLLPSRPAAAQRSDVPLAHSWQPIHVLTAVAPPPAQPRNIRVRGRDTWKGHAAPPSNSPTALLDRRQALGPFNKQLGSSRSVHMYMYETHSQTQTLRVLDGGTTNFQN